MVSLVQMQEVNRLEKLKWQSIGYQYSKEEVNKISYGGPIAMINDEGDILKVYASGDKLLIKANDWDKTATKVEGI